MSEEEGRHLETHVAVCNVRYQGINARLKRIEKIMWIALLSLIGLMATIIGFLMELKADLALPVLN